VKKIFTANTFYCECCLRQMTQKPIMGTTMLVCSNRNCGEYGVPYKPEGTIDISQVNYPPKPSA